MSTLNRKKLLQESLTLGQQTGNLNVLLTNAMAQHVGLSATEYECFEFLLHHGPMPAGKLASLCGITTGGMTGLIDRLEKLGFVERALDPTDRRRVLVQAKPNKKLQNKLWQLGEPMVKAFTELNSHYTDEQLAFMVGHYKKVNAIMEQTLADLSSDKQ